MCIGFGHGGSPKRRYFERTNSALRGHGFSEIGPQALETPLPATFPDVGNGAEISGSSMNGPKSEVAPRSAGALAASSGQAPARNRALARMLGRR